LQFLGFAIALLALTLGYDTFTRFATLSIFVRYIQMLYVLVYYEVAWSGSFRAYYAETQGVLEVVEHDVYPINFFPIFTSANYIMPIFYFPLFWTTSTNGCPQRGWHVDWQGVADGFFGSSFLSLDALGNCVSCRTHEH